MTDTTQFLNVARQAAQAAGKVVAGHFGQILDFKTKQVDDIIDVFSIADKESESTITQHIRKSFPDHNVIGEEGTAKLQNSKYTWAIDPIDGTILFQRRRPQFSILISLIDENGPLVGVMFQPLYQPSPHTEPLLFHAVRGHGAFCNNQAIAASQVSQSKAAMVGSTYNKPEVDRGSRLTPAIAKAGFQYPFIDAIASWPLSMVATGQFEGFISRTLEPWDIAAPSLLVSEAGGKVTDANSQPIDWSKATTPNHKYSIVASNGLLHNDLLQVIAD